MISVLSIRSNYTQLRKYVKEKIVQMPERPPNPGFRDRLQEAAKRKGIKNNNQFAQALGKKASATETWWKGGYPIQISDFRDLCNLLEVSADYLLFGNSINREYIIEIDAQLKRLVSDIEQKYNIVAKKEDT